MGNQTQWAYDADDRLTTLTQPNSATVTYIYDKDAELTDTTDADGRRTTYSYNADGDQTGETWVGASPAEKITYTYDADNEMTGAADSFATLTMAYNADGQLGTYVTSGPGTGQPTVTLTYSYDQLGDETSVKDSLSSQGITTYTFNNAMQMTNISTSYGGTAGPLVTFTYDNGGRLTNTSRNADSGDAVNTTITYDAANRVVTIADSALTATSFGYSNTPLATFAYGYDSASRVTTEVSADPGGTDTYTYTYDNANELTAEYENGTLENSYSYDSNGNRTGTGYSTTVMNETATSPGPVTYTYDNAGNMITSKSGSTTTTYTYDFRNRLTEVTVGGTVVATYTYNALDQRIGVDDSGTQTWTVYDGTSPDANPYDDFNSSGSLTVRYLFGPSVVNGAVVDGILARTSSGGTTAWYLTDKLGSVREIVSTSGTVLDQIVYDSFGNIVTETNAANGDRFKFAGMEYDPTTGGYFDHERWYDSQYGGFESTDPLGLASGELDLYGYVANAVTGAVDTTGLQQGGQQQGGQQTTTQTAPAPPVPTFNGQRPGTLNGNSPQLNRPPVRDRLNSPIRIEAHLDFNRQTPSLDGTLNNQPQGQNNLRPQTATLPTAPKGFHGISLTPSPAVKQDELHPLIGQPPRIPRNVARRKNVGPKKPLKIQQQGLGGAGPMQQMPQPGMQGMGGTL